MPRSYYYSVQVSTNLRQLSMRIRSYTTLEELSFGYIGADGTAISLDEFRFVSGNTSKEVSANHFDATASNDLL